MFISHCYAITVSSAFVTTPWRNGSASDSRLEGCVFKSRRGQKFFETKIEYYGHEKFVKIINMNKM